MATKTKAVHEDVQVALQCDLVERIREDAERAGQTISDWVAAAARRHLEDAEQRDVLRKHRDAAWRELLTEFEKVNGPLTEEELAAAAAQWPD
jgi:hypothetical protein